METLIYIILGIIFFIYQIFKESRKLKEKARTQRPDMNPPEDAHKPIDENYRERQEKRVEAERRIEERERRSERPYPGQRPQRMENQPKSFEELLRDFSREEETPKRATKKKPMISLEKDVDEEKIAMEKVKRDKEAADIVNQEINKKLAETKALVEKEKKAENPYAAFLKNPQTVKTAFVASEIFNRKHF